MITIKRRQNGKMVLIIIPLIMIIYITSKAFLSEIKNSNTNATKKKSISMNSHNDQEVPQVLPTDLIYQTRSAFVIPEYKLIFFTFPKVACSEWKRMFMRINGNPKWCIIEGFSAHDPRANKIETLKDYSPEIASAMMTSPVWTKAAIVREPKERVLSAFLDKAYKESYYIQKCCDKLPDEDEKQKCIDNEESFESFLYFVTTYKKECFDVHWEAQVEKIDQKWWSYIDFIGYQNNLLDDSQQLLRRLTSLKDDVEGRSAWDRYGISGWGNTNEGCEKRTHFFLEENSSTHKLQTGDHLLEWYTPKTEKIVEKYWAVEWQQEMIEFPELKLFD